MRIEQLEYVAAVTQHGSLRRASERLHVSQPALSEAVSKLERELGVTLLDRRRSGARISRPGQHLIQNMLEVLEAVDRLRTAAGDEKGASRMIRVGTVNAASSTLLVPAVREFQRHHPGSTVEVVNAQQADIDRGLAEGALDLGLVNLLASDEVPTGLASTDLVSGRPVVVLPADHPLAENDALSPEQLRTESFVLMRSGYLMHTFVNRLFGTELPTTCYSTDGAEMGKLMVAEGIGLTVLPDYSVIGDPLERAGLITFRPIAGDATTLTLVLRQRELTRLPQPVQELREALLRHAEGYRQNLVTTAKAPVTLRLPGRRPDESRVNAAL